MPTIRTFETNVADGSAIMLSIYPTATVALFVTAVVEATVLVVITMFVARALTEVVVVSVSVLDTVEY